MSKCDLVIIGAGPAGMAAAAKAAELGLTITVLDEQPRAGGQIYRDVDKASQKRKEILGQDYTYGSQLTVGLKNPSTNHICGAAVWAIEEGFQISYTRNGKAEQIKSKRILLATGALERPMPIPGWELPGVMTAGAGQILLKQSGVLARDAVLIGSGPLLYLIAAQMVRAGMPPKAMIETQNRSDRLRAMRHLGGALKGWSYLAKGLKMLAEITRAGVPRYTGATAIAINGDNKAESVTFNSRGKSHHIDCETVFLHHGVVPNTQAARSIGVSHLWNAAQSCFNPAVDDWGQTDIQGIYIAGDGAGIGGAKVAEYAGSLAALKISHEIEQISTTERDQQATPLRAKLQQNTAARPFLDRAYPPYTEALLPSDDTMICRCEEITAGDIRQYAKLGCIGPNQTKAFGRAGMGPCQGRYCGLTVSSLLAQANDQTPDETGYYRIRPPLKPLSLGELAAMNDPAQPLQPVPEATKQ